MSEIKLEKFDSWLTDDAPAALVLKEHLMPVEGIDGVLFPATFAASEDGAFKGGYNIDHYPDGSSVCLVDSVGSQANRIEPLFMKGEYAKLLPQIVVKAGSKEINLLEAGHRAGDAIVRCSVLQGELQSAFKSVLNGIAEPLARIAPTSLVFGVWDSRDTQAKLPRLVDSKIRAYNVRKLTRSAQYVPAADYVKDGLLDEPVDKKEKDAYAVKGFVHVPATATHGGIIADSGVRRDATLHLAALRLLNSENPEKTRDLQRYILGLSLVAFTAKPSSYLRAGCNLVTNPDKTIELKIVHYDGRREDLVLSHQDALAYARTVAAKFGIAENRTVEFDKQLAEKDLKEAGEKKKNKAK
jgi:CRISPR-associated protein Csb1